MKIFLKNVIFSFLLAVVSARHILRPDRSVENVTEAAVVDRECRCDLRYYSHYEAKGCQPVQLDDCNCPEKFSCPIDNEIQKDKVCLYKGKEYPVGANINVTDVCQVCKCLGRENPRVFCIPKECPPLEEHPEEGVENCHLIYRKNQCCPVSYECVSEAVIETSEEDAYCEHEGIHYPFGSRIYPKDDPCLICDCDERWNHSITVTDDRRSSSCHLHECIMERHKARFDAGCIPIYHESFCCPVEFYCPTNHVLSYSLGTSNISAIEDSNANPDSQCVFDGRSYDIGKELPINHPTHCVKCECRVPPDFTCIHQACPPPVEGNCRSYIDPDKCCTQYECIVGYEITSPITTDIEKREMSSPMVEAPVRESPCNDIRCDEDMQCMLFQVMCGNITCPPVPTCLTINNTCSTPVCASNCVVVGQDEDNCLQCACGQDISKHESDVKCQMPHCVGQNCHLVGGAGGGCPSCECDQPCEDITVCEPGCNVISEIEGRCPICVCEDETEGCPTPICADETCRIESPAGGCPTCICGYGVLENCPTPVCGDELCRIIVPLAGCPTCICDIPAQGQVQNTQQQQQQTEQVANGHAVEMEDRETFGQDSDEDMGAIQVMSENQPVSDENIEKLNKDVKVASDLGTVSSLESSGRRQP